MADQIDVNDVDFSMCIAAAWRRSGVRKTVIGGAIVCGVLIFNYYWANTSSPALTGKVIDAATGEPIPMAAVIVRWEGRQVEPWFPIPAYVETTALCYHAEFAATDAEGNYHIPAWRDFGPLGAVNRLSEKRVIVQVFRAGYKVAKSGARSGAKALPAVALVAHDGSKKDLLDSIASSVTGFCALVESARNAIPFI